MYGGEWAASCPRQLYRSDSATGGWTPQPVWVPGQQNRKEIFLAHPARSMITVLNALTQLKKISIKLVERYI